MHGSYDRPPPSCRVSVYITSTTRTASRHPHNTRVLLLFRHCIIFCTREHASIILDRGTKYSLCTTRGAEGKGAHCIVVIQNVHLAFAATWSTASNHTFNWLVRKWIHNLKLLTIAIVFRARGIVRQ